MYAALDGAIGRISILRGGPSTPCLSPTTSGQRQARTGESRAWGGKREGAEKRPTTEGGERGLCHFIYIRGWVVQRVSLRGMSCLAVVQGGRVRVSASGAGWPGLHGGGSHTGWELVYKS